MAFIRFVGCSVGKTVCTHCDTDFEKEFAWLGGGVFDPDELSDWVRPYRHVCLTGGEPLDQDLGPLIDALEDTDGIHFETSGTVEIPSWVHAVRESHPGWLHICCSPKPGFLRTVIDAADEIKVIVPGLSNGDGWPMLTDAVRWANQEKVVFLQPRNAKHDINNLNLALCEKLVNENPTLRLSVQMHKILRVR